MYNNPAPLSFLYTVILGLFSPTEAVQLLQQMHTHLDPMHTHATAPTMHPTLVTSLWVGITGCVAAAHGVRSDGGNTGGVPAQGCWGDADVQQHVHKVLHALVQCTIPLPSAAPSTAPSTAAATSAAPSKAAAGGEHSRVHVMTVLAAVATAIRGGIPGVGEHVVRAEHVVGVAGAGGGGSLGDVHAALDAQQHHDALGAQQHHDALDAQKHHDAQQQPQWGFAMYMALAVRCMMMLPAAVVDECLPEGVGGPEVRGVVWGVV